jgi:hypothetical protein
MDAVGVDGSAVAFACLTARVPLTSMGVDGVRVKHRLRRGEPLPSVLARAAA